METPFLRLAELCNSLEQISRSSEKIEYVSTFLRSLNQNELEPAVFLIIGTTFAKTDPKTLNIKWGLISKTDFDSKQTTLLQQSLTILHVHNQFEKLAQLSGPGSQKQKKRLLETLFQQATPVERKFIVRNLLKEMRHGVAQGVMIKAIAKAAKVDDLLIKKLNAIHGNLGEIALIAITEGREGLRTIELMPFKPIQPMLAESIDSIDELFEAATPQLACEYKYDGIRVQIHKYTNTVRIYSRQLKEITSSFPEIENLILKSIPNQSVILDGEIVAIGADKRPLPFQDLMRRFRRIYNAPRVQQEISVECYLFDILYLDGELLFDSPYQERWAILSKIGTHLTLATRLISADREEILRFYRAALNAGHEGLMIKSLQSSYYPGERKKYWVKLKEAVLLDLLVIAADWGSGRRTGWLSNYHLATLDPETKTFHEVGKTFKGLTDVEFEEMTKSLQELKTSETQYTVYVKPKIVVEVAFNEIQKSPQYPSGYALRFARIKRIRSDKSPADVTTLEEISRLYDRQFEKKARL
jgi:DNA ligase-1